MKRKKSLVIQKKRKIVEENIRFGLFQGKIRKDYEKLLEVLRESTECNRHLKIEELITQLQTIKQLIETKLKGKYTDIFVEVNSRYSYDDDESMVSSFTIILGRLETKEECDLRYKESEERSKEYAASQLKNEAKRYLELKKKFEPKRDKK